MKTKSKIAIVKQHHEVLYAWRSLYQRDRLAREVLTLDHHTDVLPAFNHSGYHGSYSIDSDEKFEQDVLHLRHDEHLDWALKSRIISKSIVLSHENFTQPAHPSMQVICPDEWPPTQEILNGSRQAVETAGRVLESDYLRNALAGIELNPPYILDIDLDNFLCDKAFHPNHPERIIELAGQADLITISLESDWVRLLRLPGEKITAEEISEALTNLFSMHGIR